jgi:hypothetical protein
MRKSRASSNGRPISCRPIDAPFESKPQGIDSAGTRDVALRLGARFGGPAQPVVDEAWYARALRGRNLPVKARRCVQFGTDGVSATA